MRRPTGMKPLPGYQSGREFDDELVEQLDVLARARDGLRLRLAKAAGYEADDFLAAAAAREEGRGGTPSSRVAIATPTSSRPDHDHPAADSSRRDGAHRPRGGARALWGRARTRCPTSSPCAATASDSIPGAAGIGATGAASPAAQVRLAGKRHRCRTASRAQADKLRLYRSIATMDESAPLPPLRNQKPTWGRAARSGAGLAAQPAG